MSSRDDDDDDGLPDAAFTEDELAAGVQHIMRTDNPDATSSGRRPIPWDEPAYDTEDDQCTQDADDVLSSRATAPLRFETFAQARAWSQANPGKVFTRAADGRGFESKHLLSLQLEKLNSRRPIRPVATRPNRAGGCGMSVVQAHPGQELDSGAPDQLTIADGCRSPAGVVVEVPVRPCLVPLLVVHQLEQVGGYAHLAWADAFALSDAWGIERASDHVHIARRPGGIFFRSIFDRHPPSALVVLRRLRHHVGQRKALGHGLRRGHLAGRRQVASIVSTTSIVLKRGPFGRA